MEALEAILEQHPWSDAAKQCRVELEGLLDVMSQAVSWPQSGDLADEVLSGKAVDVVRVLAGALRLVDRDASYKGMAVSLRPEQASIWAAAHPVGLVFLALHLARNARDATTSIDSPRLLIDIYTAGDEVVIEFADNGPGLADEKLQCSSSPAAKAGDKACHTGLGLMTCGELVRYMGGRMRMRSRPAQGTTVFVRLPAAAPPQ
jgi:C4-dicarboxylate-specific signal transduction histidine kinase